MTETPAISVVIPVKNGEATLSQCLDAIYAQSIINQTEVIVIDSGSTDHSIKIAKEYPVRLFRIPPEKFNHGATRNHGVSLAKGEFVVMTVQDAYASSTHWLEMMQSHFKDKKVVAVVGQQVVPHHKDINPHQWYRPVNKPRVAETWFPNQQDYLNLSGEEQDKAIFYDNVNTMYRKSALEEMPFADTMFGEDMVWMKDAVSRGHKIVCDTNASVWHYHYLSYNYTYTSTFTLLYYKYKIFNYTEKINIRFIDYLLVIYRNFKYRVQWKWIFHNLQVLQARNKAQKKFLFCHKKGDSYLQEYFQDQFSSLIQGRSGK